jgi:hypothetical protein
MNIHITHINICTWNSQGIANKFHELQLFLNTQNIDILLATETKLAPYIHFFMPGCTIIRSDIQAIVEEEGQQSSLKTISTITWDH